MRHSFVRRFGFLFLLVLVACQETEVVPMSDEVVEVLDTLEMETVAPEPVVKPKKVAVERARLPVLLIQNCGALIPHPCLGTDLENLEAEKQWLSSYFDDDSLVAIGKEGVFDVQLDSVFCMRGECNGRQFAFHVPAEVCLGVLMGKQDFQTYGPFHFIYQWRNPEFQDSTLLASLQLDSVKEMLVQEQKAVKKMPRVSDCSYHYFTDSSQQFLLQATSFAYELKLNDTMEHPPIEEMAYQAQRRLVNVDSSWLVTPWLAIHDFWGNWLPEPFAYSLTGDTLITIDYHSQGICCPSLSSLSVNAQQISLDTTIALWEESFDAGLGQGCD